jgi:hypothetical protein
VLDDLAFLHPGDVDDVRDSAIERPDPVLCAGDARLVAEARLARSLRQQLLG